MKTDAVRPNSVSLAISSASSSVEKVMIGATGPNVSSCAIRMSLVTPSTIVGSWNWPSWPPPRTIVAPFSVASSRCSCVRSSTSGVHIGPMSVSSSSGSPTRSAFVRSVRAATNSSFTDSWTRMRSAAVQHWPAR